MSSERITASAPATIANFGPCFDVAGIALAHPRDRVTAERTDSPGKVEITSLTGVSTDLPLGADENTAGVAAAHVLRTHAAPFGVRLQIEKGLPAGTGLGSSAASAAAAAFATAHLLDPSPKREQLLEACRRGEAVASGVPHPDNVAPALLGGFVLCLPLEEEGRPRPVRLCRLALPNSLRIAVSLPDVSVRTEVAREALPPVVSMADAVGQTASIAALVHALDRNDVELLGLAFRDRLSEPYRGPLVPGLEELLNLLREEEGVPAGIAGSGPAAFALTSSDERAEYLVRRMTDYWNDRNLDAKGFVTQPDPDGVRLSGQRN